MDFNHILDFWTPSQFFRIIKALKDRREAENDAINSGDGRGRRAGTGSEVLINGKPSLWVGERLKKRVPGIAESN